MLKNQQQFKMTIWLVACLFVSGALPLTSSATAELVHQQSNSPNGTQQNNATSNANLTRQLPINHSLAKNTTARARRALASAMELSEAESVSMPTSLLGLSSPKASKSSSGSGGMMGDSVGLETAIKAHDDLTPAAGEHKKYILVKKKPKHKKIKMDVYKPKYKYKKIKIKVPIKKLKKKKVKGYLVKKEKHHHEM